MELELGLSLSNCMPHKMASLKEMDLISYVNYMGKQDCDDNSSVLSCQSSVNDGDYDHEEGNLSEVLCKKKRGFDQVESNDLCLPKTLPLLLWDKHPNEDDKNFKRLCKSASVTINKNEGDEIVGWPPIKSYRKKQIEANQHQQRGRQAVENGGGCGGGSRSMYVKVQIEGYLITRKIDLMLYHSYESLISSLLYMFGKGQDCADDYKLTYQDGEGDWLLAGDVPWRCWKRHCRYQADPSEERSKNKLQQVRNLLLENCNFRAEGAVEEPVVRPGLYMTNSNKRTKKNANEHRDLMWFGLQPKAYVHPNSTLENPLI